MCRTTTNPLLCISSYYNTQTKYCWEVFYQVVSRGEYTLTEIGNSSSLRDPFIKAMNNTLLTLSFSRDSVFTLATTAEKVATCFGFLAALLSAFFFWAWILLPYVPRILVTYNGMYVHTHVT